MDVLQQLAQHKVALLHQWLGAVGQTQGCALEIPFPETESRKFACTAQLRQLGVACRRALSYQPFQFVV